MRVQFFDGDGTGHAGLDHAVDIVVQQREGALTLRDGEAIVVGIALGRKLPRIRRRGGFVFGGARACAIVSRRGTGVVLQKRPAVLERTRRSRRRRRRRRCRRDRIPIEAGEADQDEGYYGERDPGLHPSAHDVGTRR